MNSRLLPRNISGLQWRCIRGYFNKVIFRLQCPESSHSSPVHKTSFNFQEISVKLNETAKPSIISRRLHGMKLCRIMKDASKVIDDRVKNMGKISEGFRYVRINGNIILDKQSPQRRASCRLNCTNQARRKTRSRLNEENSNDKEKTIAVTKKKIYSLLKQMLESLCNLIIATTLLIIITLLVIMIVLYIL